MSDIESPQFDTPFGEIPHATHVLASILMRDAAGNLPGGSRAVEGILDTTTTSRLLLGQAALDLVNDPDLTMAEAVEQLFGDKESRREFIDTLQALEEGIDFSEYTRLHRIKELREFCKDGDLAISNLKKGEVITIEYVNSRKKKAWISVSRTKDDADQETRMDDLVVVNVAEGKTLESNFHNLEEGAIIYLGYLDGDDLEARLLRDSRPAWVLAKNIHVDSGKAYRTFTKRDNSFTLNQVYYGTDKSIPLFPPQAEPN